jgi:DNA-binding NarL/FixJ family response regulator
MRGTVLLLDSGEARASYAEFFRANGLIVFETARPEEAIKQLDTVKPDVIVTTFGPAVPSTVIRTLRTSVDDATSIIVTCADEGREQARNAGADLFLRDSALLSDVLYEIHRALILRRSGRRLSPNW